MYEKRALCILCRSGQRMCHSGMSDTTADISLKQEGEKDLPSQSEAPHLPALPKGRAETPSVKICDFATSLKEGGQVYNWVSVRR